MIRLTKEQLVNGICEILAGEPNECGISEALRFVGENCGLSGIAILEAGELPTLLELSEHWKLINDNDHSNLLFDYADLRSWNLINPYEEIHNFTVVNDVSEISIPEETDALIAQMGIRSMIFASVIKNKDFLGLMIFYYTEPHTWTKEEQALLRKVPELFYGTLVRCRRERSQQKLVEESQRYAHYLNNNRNQFLNTVSMKLRTPVNAITGMLSIMHNNMDNAEVMDQCLDRMDKAGKQLIDLISECVNSSLHDSDTSILNKSWFSQEDLVTDLKRAVNPLFKGRGQKLECNYEPEVMLNADRESVSRVLLNLLSNSAKYSDKGGTVSLDIRHEHISEKRCLFIFTVSDNGIGMEEEQIKLVHDPLSGSLIGDKRTATGTGLMVIKYLVDMMNGSVDVFSKKGVGTKIVVSIELESDHTDSADKYVNDESAEEEAGELYIGRRILIAEDNLIMAEMLAAQLGARGLETETTMNGREAVDAFCGHEPFYYDMIFMDMGMPVMDGLEATRAIRGSDAADAALIPIIALSANTFEEDKEKASEAGINAYLAKPIGSRELFETISNYIF